MMRAYERMVNLPSSLSLIETRASSLIVLVETLKDCSPKPTKLCTLKTKNQENVPLKELRARDCFLLGEYRKVGQPIRFADFQ